MKVEIDTRTFVRFWLVVIGFILAAWLLYSARSALMIIGVAFFLAIALSRPVNMLTKILPGRNRVLSTSIAYIAVLALLGVIVFLVIPPIIGQMTKFAQNVPDLVNGASKQYSGLNDFINHYQLQPQVDKVITSIKDSAGQFATDLGSFLFNGIGSLLSTVTATILVLVLTFLMLVEGPQWLKKIWSIYKDKKKMNYHRNILAKMYNVVTNYITGQLSVSAIAGLVAGLAVFALSFMFSIPADLAVPSAIIMFVLSLVPLFGEMVGNVLIGLILLLNSLTAAIIFVIFYLVYQQIEANYISPKIQSKRIDLPALAILVAVTIGIYMFGVVGGIISIPIAGCIKVIADEYLARAE
ncbi:AI-2E family transporter [Candidatus Saccharibacteria bacterium]|nr:AI-2E family transporter [Candidatus Saccharibacteria bacterium]